MPQFTKLYNDILTDKELNATDKLVYSVLLDRLQSSKKRAQFFDNDTNDYFVIYTVAEIAEFLNLSKTTAVNSYKRLTNLGYIVKKHVFNGATKLFLPTNKQPEQTDEMQEIDTPKCQKVVSNQTNLNHTNITNETKETQNHDFENLKNSLIAVGGFDIHTVNTMAALCFGNTEELKTIVGTIYKAKNVVMKANKGYNKAKAVLTLESGHYTDLKNVTKNILIHANHSKNKHGYIFAAFKKHFENVVLKQKIEDKQLIEIPLDGILQ